MKKLILLFIIFISIYSCSKTEVNVIVSNTSPVANKLSSCDSIKQGLLKNTSDTIRLISCLSINGCDSLRLGLLKPTTQDTLRLSSCIKINGCDSLRLGLLKPTTQDTLRLLSCIKINGIDSVRLGLLKISIVVTNIVNDIPADTVTGVSTEGRPISAGTTTYYSLENNKLIPESEASSAKWDVAFSSTKIIINGGTSGSGLGGAFVYKGSFDILKIIPNDSTFATDNAANSTYAIPWGAGKGWYNYDGVTTIVSPIADRVLVIRTANGKYAKIEIISYYKGGKTLPATASDIDKLIKQRFYTFKYSYQPDGSKSF
jgi:hypothetical protein